MPLMMEHDLDDLFIGDAPSLQIASPLPKGLVQRVDDLRLGGCRQYVFHFAFHMQDLQSLKAFTGELRGPY